MKQLICVLALSLFFISESKALVGEDTAMMIQLVSTTASQLNELEQLVSNAEKYTQKMREYNELFQDEYFKAERVQYLAEELASKKRVENLGDLNTAIRSLKLSMSDLNRLMKEYGAIKDDETKTKEEVKIETALNEKKKARAQKQVASSLTAPTVGRSNQLTAQNTALIHETQLDMHKTELELLENSSTTNRLLAEQLEEKRVEQIEKEKRTALKVRGRNE